MSDGSGKRTRSKCVAILRLQGDAYRNLFNLARVCRAYELKPHCEQVLQRMKEVLSEPPVAPHFVGWTDKRLSQYFYTHFIRRNPVSESARRKRELIIIVSGCHDEADSKVRQMEVTRGLGSYMEERLGRPLSYPFGPRPANPSELSANYSRKRSRAETDSVGEQRQDMEVDDVNDSEEEDTTAESSLMKNIEHQDKKLATCALEDIGESSTVDPAIESS